MSETKPLSLTDDDFDQWVLSTDGVSVVDFWAPWCGPCHQMAPSLEAFAKSNAGKVRVFKLDVDENPKIAEKYEIRTVPTVIFFVRGEAQEVVMGAMSQSALQKKLDEMLEL